MKKFASLALIAASLAVSAQAFILGADAGYLVDAKEEYISARFAYAFKSDASLTHQVEAEIGFTSQKESFVTGEFLPVTINYRGETVAANKLGFYFGAGAGFARTTLKVLSYPSEHATSFAAQAFAGLNYQVSAKASLHAGAKYIWIDDVKLFGIKADVGDDVALSAGFSFKF